MWVKTTLVVMEQMDHGLDVMSYSTMRVAPLLLMMNQTNLWKNARES
jgi:hypothetical protein